MADDKTPAIAGVADQAQLLATCQRAVDQAHRAQLIATAAEAQGVALKDMLALHLRQRDEDRATLTSFTVAAQEGRQRIYEKIDAVATGTAEAIAALRTAVEGDILAVAETARGKVEGNRAWVVGVILAVAATVIVAQTGIIAWLAIELYEMPGRGLGRGGGPG